MEDKSILKITYTISKLITIEPWDVISKINYKLVELDYNIIYKDEYTIKFYDPFWRPGSRTKTFTKVDGGKFQVITSEKETKLIFTYYVSFTEIIFFAIFFIPLSVIIDYHIIYILVVFFLMFLLRIDNVKSLGKEMMNNIIISLSE